MNVLFIPFSCILTQRNGHRLGLQSRVLRTACSGVGKTGRSLKALTGWSQGWEDSATCTPVKALPHRLSLSS